MADLRQILALGRKRIGLLIGAGAPASVKVNEKGELDRDGQPLIPDVERLTQAVVADLEQDDMAVVEALLPELGKNPNMRFCASSDITAPTAIGHSVNVTAPSNNLLLLHATRAR